MSARTPKLSAEERTPQARLSEGLLHRILGYQLAQASIVTDQIFEEQVRGRDDLRRVEYTILGLVQGNPDVNARQLARALAVTPPNVAVMLDRLEVRGLIERVRSRQDARMQHIRITRGGARLVELCTQRLLQAEEQALGTLSAAERAILVELLHKAALARRRGDGPG